MKKFKLQKTLSLLLSGVIISTAVGCTKSKNDSNEPLYTTSTLADADDAVIYGYVRELMNDSAEKIADSPYKDQLFPVYEEYKKAYRSMIGTYDEYLIVTGVKDAYDENDQLMLELFPLSKESIQKKHNLFISYAKQAEKYATLYDPENTFACTIYAYAVVKEEDIDTYPDATQRPYYIPLEMALAQGLLPEEFNMSNLPDNCEIINNQLYVKASTVEKITEEGLILKKSK